MEKTNIKIVKEDDILEQVRLCLPHKVMLYQKASLLMTQHSFKIDSINPGQAKDLNCSFSIGGELSGQALCTLDLNAFAKLPCNLSFLQSLFIESMNILLGNLLTNLDSHIGVLCLISPPSFFLEEQASEKLKGTFPQSHLMNAQYELHLFDVKIPVNVYLQWVTQRAAVA